MKKVLLYWDQSKTSREHLTESARQYRAFCDMAPWELRRKAIKGEKLTLQQIGRICYHFAHQRGFNEKMLSLDEKDAKVLKDGKPIEDKIGAIDTQKALEKQDYPFLGYYLATLFPVKKKPYQQQERIRNRHTYRSMYIAEFEHIWQTQKKYYPDQLSDTLYKKLHHHLFFQLPLQQPPKGRCRLEPHKPRALKASLLFERFQLHKFLNNLRINGEELTPSTRKIITAFYHKKALTKTPKFTIEKLKEHLTKKEPFEKHYINFKPKEVITTAPLTSQLTHIFTAKVWEALTEKEKTDRWHIIFDNYKYNADFLQAYAEEKWKLSAKALEELAKIRMPAGVAKFSEKALRYIVPYLEKGFTEDKALLLGSVKKSFGHHFGDEEKAGQPNHWKALSPEEKEAIESACIDIVKNHDSGHLEEVKSYLSAHYPTKAYALDKIYAHTNLYTTQPQREVRRSCAYTQPASKQSAVCT